MEIRKQGIGWRRVHKGNQEKGNFLGRSRVKKGQPGQRELETVIDTVESCRGHVSSISLTIIKLCFV